MLEAATRAVVAWEAVGVGSSIGGRFGQHGDSVSGEGEVMSERASAMWATMAREATAWAATMGVGGGRRQEGGGEGGSRVGSGGERSSGEDSSNKGGKGGGGKQGP